MALTTGKGAIRFETEDGDFLILGYTTYANALTDATAMRAAAVAGTKVMVTLGDGRSYFLNQAGSVTAFQVDAVVTG